jgi:flagellar motor component MotA
MSRYSKAIAAVVGLVVSLGVLDQETAQEIGAAVTALLVYLVPNS